MDEINLLHHIVCNGDLTQKDSLEAKNADEYYTEINTFLRFTKEKEKEQEKQANK